jgi:hydrogenase maturation protease
MRDDGVRVRVIDEMSKLRLSDEVELYDRGTAGLGLESILEYRRKVVVIDAMQADVEPGTVLRLLPKDRTEQTEGGITPH